MLKKILFINLFLCINLSFAQDKITKEQNNDKGVVSFVKKYTSLLPSALIGIATGAICNIVENIPMSYFTDKDTINKILKSKKSFDRCSKNEQAVLTQNLIAGLLTISATWPCESSIRNHLIKDLNAHLQNHESTINSKKLNYTIACIASWLSYFATANITHKACNP